MDYVVRKARLEDREAIQQLIAASARELSRNYYQDSQVEAAIETVFGVDTDLIDDGTYFVAESETSLAGCGGWSMRKNLYGGDQYANRDSRRLDPQTDPAKIRAFFVHPEHARKGIARRILECCEEEARGFGFSSLELMATLPGIPFYEALSYQAGESFYLDMGHGLQLELVRMRKGL